MSIWGFSVGTALCSWLLTRMLMNSRIAQRFLDRPGTRSLHHRMTPRTGGLAMLAALTLGAIVASASETALWLDPYLIGGVLLLAVVSLIDDARGLRPEPRLAAQAIATGALLWSGYGLDQVQLPGGWQIPLGRVGLPVSVLFVIWMTNLYNFMDGVDGMACGMGTVGFGTLGLIAGFRGHEEYALAAALVAGVNAGFMAENFPPARLFMGDVGAIPMGFLAAAFALVGEREGILPLWLAVLIFSPFVVDASVTLLRRLLRGERVWEAHRSHHYQRLVLLGWSHRRTALASYLIMLGTSGTALAITIRGGAKAELAAVMGWGVVFLLLALMIAGLERRSRTGRELTGHTFRSPD